jgi:glycosyltransferase involved in cell wall biosynthesis
VVPPGDPVALAAAIRSLAAKTPAERSALGDSGRRYLAAHFQRQEVIGEYERELLEVAGGPRG